MGLIGELVVKITGNTAALNKSIDASQKRLQKLSAGFVKAGKTLTKSLTLPIVALGAVSVRAFGKQAEAEAKLNAAIRATGKESEISAKNIKAFAAELQKTTLFGDEATISATALLQSFANLNERGLKQIIPGILDMSAAMGISLETAATLVGKTLGSTTNALSRYGIVIDAAADKSVKLTAITEQLKEKFGGTAEEIASSGVGALKQLQNTLGDLAESIGEIIIPVLNDIVEVIKGWADAFAALDTKTKENIVTILTIAAVVGPVLIIIGKLILIVKGLITAFVAVKAAVLAFSAALSISPIGLVVAAVGLLAGGLLALLLNTKNQTEVQKDFNKELEESIEKLEAIKRLAPATEAEKAAGALLVKQARLMDAINALIEKNKTLRREVLAAAIQGTAAGNAEAATTQKIINQNETRIAQLQRELVLLNQRATTKKEDLEGDAERAETQLESEQEFSDAIREIRAKRAQEAIDLRNGITKATIDANQKEIDDAAAAAEAKKAIDQAVFDSAVSLQQSLFSIIGSVSREHAVLQKALGVTQATINAALAVSNVIATVPFFAWPIAIPAAVAAGAAQIVAILSQSIPQLAEGGVFTGPAIVGEAGPEVALPLTDEVFARLAAAIETAKTSSVVNQLVDDRPIDLNVGVNIDGKRLNAYISGESRNGRIIIDRSRGVTKK